MKPEEFTASPQDVKRESARRTRRSFVAGGAAAAAGYGLWYAINNGRDEGRQPAGLRKTFETDAAISRTVFAERGLSPTFPLSAARELRLNGVVGLEKELKLDSWRLQLVGVRDAERSPRYSKDVTAYEYQYAGEAAHDAQAVDVKTAPGNGAVSKTGAPAQKSTSLAERFDAMNRAIHHKRVRGDAEAGPSSSSLDDGTPGLLLTMADLNALPQTEFVTQFKCIEGWSEIVQWGGVRLRDLIDAYPPAPVNGREPRFVYMETPDGNYYGGYDMAAARHPQSLLVTHMSGQPLTQAHGAPLRLHMPIKYGYKQLKRIGLIAYMDTRPDDYWTKLGYDWYAGL